MGNKASTKHKPTTHSSNSVLKRMDNELGKYYKQFGRTDYYDENGNGKFLKFIKINKLSVQDIVSQLADINSYDCLFMKIDPQFPLRNESKETRLTLRNNEIFKTFQHCLTVGEAPILKQKNYIYGIYKLIEFTNQNNKNGSDILQL